MDENIFPPFFIRNGKFLVKTTVSICFDKKPDFYLHTLQELELLVEEDYGWNEAFCYFKTPT